MLSLFSLRRTSSIFVIICEVGCTFEEVLHFIYGWENTKQIIRFSTTWRRNVLFMWEVNLASVQLVGLGQGPPRARAQERGLIFGNVLSQGFHRT